MNVFYSTEIEKHQIALRDQEAAHCSKVMRKSVGSEVIVVDGKGGRFFCEIAEIKRQVVMLDIKRTAHEEIDPMLPHLAFGIIKSNTRLEWLLEKVTEIGVSRISPIISAHGEREHINHTRLNKILVSAMKQSLRSHLPRLDEPQQMTDFLKQANCDNGYIASYGDQIPELTTVIDSTKRSTMLIGPEGDFTSTEVEEAVKAGFKRVNLGNKRLRTETAGVVAVTIANYSPL